MIKEVPAGVIGKRQWWSLGEYTAIVAYGDTECGISICDFDNRDITERIAERLRASGRDVETALSIDAVILMCAENNLPDMLSYIEEVLERF